MSRKRRGGGSMIWHHTNYSNEYIVQYISNMQTDTNNRITTEYA